jgi:hypothetical protein
MPAASLHRMTPHDAWSTFCPESFSYGSDMLTGMTVTPPKPADEQEPAQTLIRRSAHQFRTEGDTMLARRLFISLTRYGRATIRMRRSAAGLGHESTLQHFTFVTKSGFDITVDWPSVILAIGRRGRDTREHDIVSQYHYANFTGPRRSHIAVFTSYAAYTAY